LWFHRWIRQAVLHIRDGRIGHEQWPADFEECRPLDGLYVSPEMTVAIAQIAVHLPPGHGSIFMGIGLPQKLYRTNAEAIPAFARVSRTFERLLAASVEPP